MVAEYDIHRKSYKYGAEDWQLLVNILHDYSEKLVDLSHQLSKEKNSYKLRVSTTLFMRLVLISLILSVLIIGLVSTYETVFFYYSLSRILITFLGLIFLIAGIIKILYDFTNKSNYLNLTFKQLEKDNRVLASRLESALRLTISVADQVEISLAKKLEMDLYIDEASSALEYYYLISDFKYKYKSSKEKQLVDPFSNAIERLESSEAKTRIQAIYDLEQISTFFPDKYFIMSMEILSAFIRDKCAQHTFIIDKPSDIPDDIQAALIVLGRRDTSENFINRVSINLSKVNLRFIDVPGFNFQNVDFRDSNLENSNFKGSDLRNADLRGTQLVCADLSDSNLSNAKFSNSNLYHANLSRTKLSNTTFNNVLFTKANLSNVDFSNSFLSNISFREADLRNVDFSNAHLVNIDFQEADLRNAKLINIYSSGVNLDGINVTDVDFRGTDKTKILNLAS
jgi:uncharacterized protein YjbI with pentapeptide repeats